VKRQLVVNRPIKAGFLRKKITTVDISQHKKIVIEGNFDHEIVLSNIRLITRREATTISKDTLRISKLRDVFCILVNYCNKGKLQNCF